MPTQNNLLTAENQKWLAKFAATQGRPLRILHISNIANNAYNNAKLLNQCMTINHVIAANDKYAMGCPEWEDADFEDDIDDMWNPSWLAINLKGFERPEWFVQGSYEHCCDHLQSLCELENNRLHKEKNKRIIATIKLSIKWFKRYMKFVASSLKQKIKYFLNTIDMYFGSNTLNKVASSYRKIRSRAESVQNKDSQSDEILSIDNSNYFVVEKKKANAPFGQWSRDEQLVKIFSSEFPKREDKLTEKDFINYYFSRPYMSKLMDCYDIVIGYATEGTYPLMSSRPYVAFEHGTIRDIPYEKDTQGRLCSLAYRMANHVFVTNFDCLESAKFLAQGKFTLINHPYDEDHGENIESVDNLKRDINLKLDSEFLFFFPTRHDWVEGTGYADKANDIFLRAFCRLRQNGYRVGLVCCEWGGNVNDSKSLLNDLGCGRHVMWVKPMPVVRFERMAKAADLVVDQFKLGAFGGVMFKAMCVGAAVMTYLDVARVRRQYQIEPPVINCKTEEEIYTNAIKLISSPQMLLKSKAESRAWIKEFHGKTSLVNAEIAVFRQILSGNHLTNHQTGW